MKNTLSVFDPKVPSKLRQTQEWFASIITRPIDENSKMNPVSPKGFPMKEEAKHYIRPNKVLAPHQRIELYNQQYWWRLLSNLHEIFPFLTRLFGYELFNQTIGVPYLIKYPPNQWSLNTLGSRLPKWIEEDYHEEDRELVLNAAKIDCAFNDAFLVHTMPALQLSQLPDPNDISSLLNLNLFLQPHLHLFRFSHDLFALRKEMIKKEGDYWIDHDFPELPAEREYFYVLFRNSHQNISWEEVSHAEYILLESFKTGTSIEKACENLEEQASNILQEAFAHLALWFQKWVIRSWLSLNQRKSVDDL